VHGAQTRAGPAPKMRGMATPHIPATEAPVNDGASKLDAPPDATADHESVQAGEAAAPDAPRTFQAVSKLNPGLDPFICLGF
jgi:hypothetical protein